MLVVRTRTNRLVQTRLAHLAIEGQPRRSHANTILSCQARRRCMWRQAWHMRTPIATEPQKSGGAAHCAAADPRKPAGEGGCDGAGSPAAAPGPEAAAGPGGGAAPQVPPLRRAAAAPPAAAAPARLQKRWRVGGDRRGQHAQQPQDGFGFARACAGAGDAALAVHLQIIRADSLCMPSANVLLCVPSALQLQRHRGLLCQSPAAAGSNFRTQSRSRALSTGRASSSISTTVVTPSTAASCELTQLAEIGSSPQAA